MTQRDDTTAGGGIHRGGGRGGAKAPIALLGAGRIGTALARAALAAGHPTAVWNRTPAKSAPLGREGARVAASAREAVEAAELVVGVVSDYAATEALLREADGAGALRGRTFVQLASGVPEQARALAARAAERGVRYLDGAIMATPDFVGRPDATILYAGPRALFDEHAPALRAFGGNAVFAGPGPGDANALDNALLVGLWGALHGALQGAAICEAEGLDLRLFGATFGGLQPVIDASTAGAIARIAGRRFAADADTAATVATCHASVRHVLAISRSRGLDGGLPEALDRVFQRAVDAGAADDDVAAVYRGLTPSPG